MGVAAPRHQWEVGVHDPLKILVTGLSIFVKLLSRKKVSQKIMENPPS